MFGNKNSQALIHLPGNTTPTSDVPLPRGECAFIQNDCGGEKSTHQRCACRSFYPADPVLRSVCGCGHQAWHHEAEPLSKVVLQEHLEVIEEVKRLRSRVAQFEQLERDIKIEQKTREEQYRLQKATEQRVYENMRLLKVQMDDKVEAVVDKTQEFNDAIKAVQERLNMVDEVTMDLENRVDQLEHPDPLSSRIATPRAVTPKPISQPPVPALPAPQSISPLPLLMQPQPLLGKLPIRSDKKYPQSWSVRAVFVPCKSLKFAYEAGSNGYRRCASRKLQQLLEFPSPDSSCFANRVETIFKGVLRGRPWMPLRGRRPADEPFGRMSLHPLPQELTVRDLWDHFFLEDHCIAHDKQQGDVLYITLQFEDVTWNEIRFLPPVPNFDESCWAHDEELDGDGGAPFKSLDTEIMYDYADPPPTYSSRTQTQPHLLADRGAAKHALAIAVAEKRAPSKLDVLADSASMLARVNIERIPTQSTLGTLSTQSTQSTAMSTRSTPSVRTYFSSISSDRSSIASIAHSERHAHSLRSFDHEETDDEHRDKKPKLRAKQSLPHVSSASAAPIYVSGRSKRKMPVREKGIKEPLHFSVANVAKWRPGALLHPHSSKGKESAQAQAAAAQAQAQAQEMR